MKPFKPHKKTCRNTECRKRFDVTTPRQARVTWCSEDCAIAIVRRKRERAKAEQERKERRELREAKEKIKPRSAYMKEAQAVINRYVRLRDARLGCISCNKPPTWNGQWHASHFRSVGAAPHLRFNLWNIHKACSVCNNHLSGNIMAYRPALIEKIGEERVLQLESAQGRAGHDIEYLIRLKRVFSRKCRRIERALQ